MARYSQGKYGDGSHYGKAAITEDGPLTWIFLVDWDGDGAYDGTNEGFWISNYSSKRGRKDYLNAEGGGFEHMDPDTVTLTMYNQDRRYDPRNAESPLSPNVFPGKKCQIAVMDNSTDPRTRKTRFTGYIDSISPSAGTQMITITCKGNLQVLADQDLTSRAAHVNTTVHDAFIDLLDEAHYPGGIAIDPDTQPVISFAVDKQKAAEAAGQLADAALGIFFVDAEGVAKYYARNHDYGTAVAIDEDDDGLQRGFGIPQPWENVFNQTDVVCRKQVREQPSVVFFLSNPLEFSGSPLVIDLYPSFESSGDVASGTLEANTQADGKGANIRTSVICTVFDIGPMGGHIRLQSSTPGWVTKLEIRGRKWKEVEELFSHEEAARYGNRKFTLDSPFLQDRNYASAFMGILWQFLDDDRESLVLQFKACPAVQFALELLTKIDFTSADFDIDSTYWIMGIDEDWLTPTGSAAVTTFYLSKIISDATSITPAFIEEELPAPLGLDNPAGDPETQAAAGTGVGSGTFSQVLYLMAFEAAIDPGSPRWTAKTVTFDTEIFDPENIFTAPGSTITVQKAGRYMLVLTGYGQSNIDGGQADSGILAIYDSFIAYKNTVQISQNYPTSAFARAIDTGTYWQARGFVSNTIVCDFAIGDELTVDLNLVCFVAEADEVSREYRLGLVMYKIAEV